MSFRINSSLQIAFTDSFNVLAPQKQKALARVLKMLYVNRASQFVGNLSQMMEA